MAAPACDVVLLADAPDLAVAWATLHWREWGGEPGREALDWWVADARRALGRSSPPVAFLARSPDGDVLGGLGIHEDDLEARRDCSPWLVGVIVRPDLRGQGIGQTLVAHAEAWARGVGTPRLWVATEAGSRAVTFYRHCGYNLVEEVAAPRRGLVAVLRKELEYPGG